MSKPRDGLIFKNLFIYLFGALKVTYINSVERGVMTMILLLPDLADED